MPAHVETHEAVPAAVLRALARAIRASPLFTTNTLNRDFVGTRGFSVVFRRSELARVAREFPAFGPYLALALRPDANAFYLNPLELAQGSRVDPHVDRSLRSYLKDILPPLEVSVLYLELPPAMQGGELVLARGKKHLARIRPVPGMLVRFEGDLTHSIARLESPGKRLSLVCEQYELTSDELEQVPAYALESRASY
jgi:hypothetical protein